MESNKYNTKEQIKEYQAKEVKLIEYILFCSSKGFMTEKTKEGLLRIINLEAYAESKGNNTIR